MNNKYIKVKDNAFKQFKFNVWAEDKETYDLFVKIPENYLGSYIIKKILDYKNIKIKRLIITKEKDKETFLHDAKTRTLSMSIQTYLKFMYSGFVQEQKSPLMLTNFAYENDIAI